MAVQSLARFTPQLGTDIMIWNLLPSQTFSAQSVYKVLAHGGKFRSATTYIWKAPVTPSMRCFFFLLINDRILTHDVMIRRGFQCDPRCIMCVTSHLETAMHLLFQCPYAVAIWSALALTDGQMNLILRDSILLTLLASVPVNKQYCKPWINLFITALWMLWKERNERIFRGKHTPVQVLLDRIRYEAQMSLRYC